MILCQILALLLSPYLKVNIAFFPEAAYLKLRGNLNNNISYNMSALHDLEYSHFLDNLNKLVKDRIAMVYYAEALHNELEGYIKDF